VRHLATILFILLAVNAGATTNYVGPTNAGSADGTSWADRFTIDSLNAYVSHGDTNRFSSSARYTQVSITPPVYDRPKFCDTCGYTYFVDSLWPGEGVSYTPAYPIITGATLLSGTWGVVSGSIYALSGVDSATVPRWGPVSSGLICVTWGSTDSLLKPSGSRSLSEGECFYSESGDSVFVYLPGGVDPNSYDVYASRNSAINTRYGGGVDYDFIYVQGLDFRIGAPGVVVWGSQFNDSKWIDCKMSRGVSSSAAGNGGVIHSSERGFADDDDWGGNHLVKRDSLTYGYDVAVGTGDGRLADIYSQSRVVFDSCYFNHAQSDAIYFKEAYQVTNGRDSASVVRFCIFDSDIGQHAVQWYKNNNYDSTYGNIFYTNPNRSLSFNDLASDASNIGNMFYGNNTFIYSGAETFVGYGSDVVGGSKFMYNIIYDPTWNSYPYILVNGSEDNFTFDYNIIYEPDVAFTVNINSTTTDSATWINDSLQDVHSTFSDPGFDSVSASNYWLGLARSGASSEMNVTYGGRTWTLYGAVQPSAAASDTTTVLINGSTHNNGKVEIQ